MSSSSNDLPPSESFWHRLGLEDPDQSTELAATFVTRTLPRTRRGRPPAEEAPAAGPDAVVDLRSLPRLAVLEVDSCDEATRAMGSNETERTAVIIPDLELLGLLGEGGMGYVQLARQSSLNRQVAVKRLRQDNIDPTTVRMLLYEARITGELEHPNVIPVHALGVNSSNQPLLVMRRVEGVSWGELIRSPSHPAWDSVGLETRDRILYHLEILMAVCNAVSFAHSREIIHRDIKPENVMIGPFGEVYVLDWGIALRRTRPPLLVDEELTARADSVDRRGEAPGTAGASPGAAAGSRRSASPFSAAATLGTPGYMAPEMLEADPSRVDERTDVYLLGASLHEALTGLTRHQGSTFRAIVESIFTSAPFQYDSAIPAELAEICNRATSRNPGDRYPTARAFRDDLTAFVRHRGSIQLTQAAMERLDALRSRIALETADDAFLPSVSKLFAECRFGFLLALREWEQNKAARAGLQACLTLMAGYEIDARNVAGAAALLSELPEADVALAGRLEDLKGQLESQRRHQARLEEMRQELDFSMSYRQWSRFCYGMGLLFTVATIGRVMVIHSRGRQDTALTLLASGSVLTAFVGAGIFMGRRSLFGNAINRRFTAMLILGPLAVNLNRVLGYLFNLPVAAVLAGDMLLMGLTLGCMAINIQRWFWPMSLMLTVTAFLNYRLPAYASANVIAVTALVFFLCGHFWLQVGRSSGEPV